MRKYFNIDYWELAVQNLPPLLRYEVFIGLVQAIFGAVETVFSLFSNNRNENIYNLSITPQVCYLEKALNDRFDLSDRRIYISDGVFYERLYIYTRAENKPIYIYNRSENKPVYLNTRKETGSDNYDFIVNVPSGLKYNKAEMIAFVEMYKLASKLFTINEF